jgi:hypothetical protein
MGLGDKCSWCGKIVRKGLKRLDAGGEMHTFHPRCWKAMCAALRVK